MRIILSYSDYISFIHLIKRYDVININMLLYAFSIMLYDFIKIIKYTDSQLSKITVMFPIIVKVDNFEKLWTKCDSIMLILLNS